MFFFLRAGLFITTGSLGGLLSLMLLARVLYPPFDWRAFIGVASFGALSGYTVKEGFRLWKEAGRYMR